MAGPVFISYSHADHGYVGRLVTFLAARGIQSWFDFDIDTKKPFDQGIQRALDESVAFIVILTPRAVASQWVNTEIAYADGIHKPIRPLLLEACEMPILLAEMQLEDVRGARMPGSRFIDDLAQLVTKGIATPTEVSRRRTASGYVFVSYSRRDLEYVTRLVAHLRSAGLQIWVDDEVELGDRWISVVRAKVDGCSAFVAVMTPDAEASKRVEREIVRAEDRRKPILPLLLAGEPPIQLNNIQYESVIGGELPSVAFIAHLRALTVG